MRRKDVHFNFGDFVNCLRIAIVPGHYEQQRIDATIGFCKKYSFSNVMLFINAEEYNRGHMTAEEARPWVACIKRAKSALEENGISVSLNPWMEIGHLDRGRTLKEGQDFQTMVDLNGKAASMVACPLDPNWQGYFREFYTYLLKEIEPEIVWIEDDFRFHNHGDLEYGGCFCPIHMREYNGRLGTDYTREEFVEKVFAQGKASKERICWLDTQRESMNKTAGFFGEIVREASPNTKVGLMSSTAAKHCSEGRDWRAVHKGLSGTGIKIDRIHLPCYIECGGKEYYTQFNSTSMIVRAFLEDDVLVYPELENAAFSPFCKSPRFLRFQLESSIPLVISGMTYDIFDFTGNGPIEAFGYGQEIRNLYPYMRAVQKLELHFSRMRGMVLPVSEKACYYKEDVRTWQELHPDEFDFAGLVGGLGLNYCLRADKGIKDAFVALTGDASSAFDDEELARLFAENFVFADGKTVLLLQERGLLRLIGARQAEMLKSDTGRQSYEQLDVEIMQGCAINGWRASAQAKAGDYVRIEYENSENLKVYTRLYDHCEEYVGKGVVAGKTFAVWPYVLHGQQYEQYNLMRRAVLSDILFACEKIQVISAEEGVFPYLFETDGQYVLILVNATVDSFADIRFKVKGVDFTGISLLDKRTGRVEKAKFSRQGAEVKIDQAFEYLSTHTLLLNK